MLSAQAQGRRAAQESEEVMNNMDKLARFIEENTLRGACQCRKCVDAIEHPEEEQPDHGVNLTFFRVAATDLTRGDELRVLVQEEYPDLLDGREHNYMEIGATIGDQGLALMLIGLGHVLGIWKALTPDTIMPFLPDDVKQQMAGNGMVALKYTRPVVEVMP